ncbi:SDR family NAD(P)-dependent oxidoreductase [Gemmobacter sp.]|uniref:SDR family NAD(P)-dependent oxidoreductase n=1 Tax=Gemmobacter sp. TaxID=1898957 RepID=UPI002AFF7BFB|nr:SDR family oxidoreductase [Gemmobacter sp.]
MTHDPRPLALVAGGSGGIGAAICRALAAEGHDIALTYRGNQARAAQVVADCRALGADARADAVDLTDAAALRAHVDLLAHHAPLRSVVYAAGPKLSFGYTSRIAPDEWLRVMLADTGGCFNLIHACVPHLKAAGGGSLVALITAAVERVPSQDVLSSAPKAAIEQLMRGIAKEEGRFGIRANCVGPGFILAGMTEDMFGREGLGDFQESIRRSLPLKRFGRAEEVADCVAFLCSDRAAYITGQSIAVDGGLQL